MIATDRTAMFAITFTVGYAVIYTVSTEFNLPLVTYHPVIGEIDFLSKPPRSGPAMYWYGWMLTSLIGATILALIAAVTPEAWLQRAITFGALAAVSYLVVFSLALFVYDKATVELEFLKSRWLSVVAAIVLATAVSLFTPTSWNERVWPGWVWVVPVGAIAVLGYYLTPYFTR
jgi:hypothetical protein